VYDSLRESVVPSPLTYVVVFDDAFRFRSEEGVVNVAAPS
jgi:hypothetical protein